MKTTQLRRYEIEPHLFDEFVDWMTSRLIPTREAAGFTVEFAYANREASEFVWAVSVDGDHERFGEVNAAYQSSPERTAAFEGVPNYATAQHADFVERIR